MTLRLSTVILPHQRWHQGGRATWQRAEDLGFHAAYTYDHLSWRDFRDGPWLAAVPTLTAAAAATDRIRLGTLVSSPNFRHPVPFAKDLIGLEDVAAGRITVGVGAGTVGYDATVLGQEPWTPRERTDRFAEFVQMLDQLLTQPEGVTEIGAHYASDGARNLPGCIQRPRIPFAIAATGPRGLRVAAEYGDAWVTTGDPFLADDSTAADSRAAIARQLVGLDEACVGSDRQVRDRIMLTGFTPERPLDSVEAFADFAGAHAALGITEIVVHWPIPESQFATDPEVFEQIATEGLSRLG